jgi:hypothetical protein
MALLGERTDISFASGTQMQTPRIKLLSVKELLELPPPEWLIDGVMEEGAFAVLYGPSNEGKTFVALDWSLSIATNRKWHGRAVSKGAVVYVVAEGGRNIGKRIAAWMQEHGVDDVEDMFAVLQAVQVTSPQDVRELEEVIQQHRVRPRLIVIDTLARCFGGGDENSAKDMGQFVAACDRLRHVSGASVLAVHHTGKGMNATTERGSSALRGAADAMIHVQKKNDAICVEVDKQKDAELTKEMHFRLRQVQIRDMRGNQSTSCVLVPSDAADSGFGPMLGQPLLGTLRALVEQPGSVAESAAWRSDVSRPDGKQMPRETFHRHQRVLIDKNFVERVEGRDHWYRATELGIATAKRYCNRDGCQRERVVLADSQHFCFELIQIVSSHFI